MSKNSIKCCGYQAFNLFPPIQMSHHSFPCENNALYFLSTMDTNHMCPFFNLHQYQNFQTSKVTYISIGMFYWKYLVYWKIKWQPKDTRSMTKIREKKHKHHFCIGQILQHLHCPICLFTNNHGIIKSHPE